MENVYVIGDTVTVTLTPVNGTATVKINDKVYTVTDNVVSFKANATGNYTVVATIAESDNYYGSSATATFEIIKATSGIGIDVDEVYKVGDDIVITLSPVNSTGDVSVTINGESYTVVNKVVNITGGLPNGTYTIIANLTGNANYGPSCNHTVFKVVKDDLTISVSDVSDPATIVVGSPVTFTATLGKEVTGDVVFVINGANYTVHVVDASVATFTYTPLNNATLTVVANFTGNDRYNSKVSAPKQFTVDKVASDVLVKADNITFGDVAVINITVTPGATGNVTVTIGDEFNKTVGITDGITSVIVPGLTYGNKTVEVTFNGDDRLMPSTAQTKFTVSNSTTALAAVVQNITYGEIETITVITNATGGTVTVRIDGQADREQEIKDGRAEFSIEGLGAGNYTAEIIYKGDGGFNDTSIKVNFTVEKADPKITVNTSDIVYGDVEHIIIRSNAEGNVTVKINGIEIPVVLIFNGEDWTGKLMASRWNNDNTLNNQVKLNVEGLEAGKYNVEVTFNGNDDYSKVTATDDFVVSKANATISIG